MQLCSETLQPGEIGSHTTWAATGNGSIALRCFRKRTYGQNAKISAIPGDPARSVLYPTTTIQRSSKMRLARGVSDGCKSDVTLPLPPGLPLWNVARQRPQFFCAGPLYSFESPKSGDHSRLFFETLRCS